ncbi:MAG: glucosidase, partial [Bryobacteraceae bacterium]
KRGKLDPEFEILDTGVFDGDRYFDVFTEYAKATVDDILVRITVVNRGPEPSLLHLLPQIWFRNTWSWTFNAEKPRLWRAGETSIALHDESLGEFQFDVEPFEDFKLLFTENETNSQKLWHYGDGFFKDAFHDVVVAGVSGAVNPSEYGTKAAAWYALPLAAGETKSIHLRLSRARSAPVLDHDQIFADRIAEADDFYSFAPPDLSRDGRNVQRQAFAGLLWSKQYYHFVVEDWLMGDPAQPPPPQQRKSGRDSSWTHLFNEDVVSMPDKWEYPWYAAWDLAFHMIPMALVDPGFAKSQLSLLLREWYMHPNGQIPAYEWAFGDVNPPVHAWSCWRVYQIDRKLTGRADTSFLEAAFHKLLLNFTWWVNRKDSAGNNIFEGGFLGLDNIGVFDRSAPLPTGGVLEQSDGTSWMAMFCLNMLKIALELSRTNHVYEDVASKFFEHFLHIADAMNRLGGDGLWDDGEGFYFDCLRFPDNTHLPMTVWSMVGLIPLFAVEVLDKELIDSRPGFKKRMEWFLKNRKDLCGNIASMTRSGADERRMLSMVTPGKLVRILQRMLDETEFLSPHGIRSLSKRHEQSPYRLDVDGMAYRVDYEPAESRSGMFGGNSNWRGPVWFPPNYLIIESLQKFDYYFGESFVVEFPTGSGRRVRLREVAAELSRRLSRLFLLDSGGRRPVFGGNERFQNDPNFRDYVPFFEYFNGDNGTGLGASHQTGWTALVAKLLQQSGE